jgi:hypothetical protein
MVKHSAIVVLLALAVVSIGACSSVKDPADGDAASVDAPASRELDDCPELTGESRTPSRSELKGMQIRGLVVCRRTSPSTGDPNGDRYKLEKVVRVAPAQGSQIVQMLADGERVGAARCLMIDSPPPVMDMLQITDETGTVWSVDVPQPDCVGYRLAGTPALQALSVSGAIGDVLYPG